MQVTKEISTLLKANKKSFDNVGITDDNEDGAFEVVTEGIDVGKLETLWNEAIPEAEATKTSSSWQGLEVREKGWWCVVDCEPSRYVQQTKLQERLTVLR